MMLDENGKYTVLDLNDALTLTLEDAETAGVEVPSGSVEDQINTWLAQVFMRLDQAAYASYVKQFNPTGSDIDLQNPGTPRLDAGTASGYLSLYNPTGGTISVPSGTVFTAPNGNTYTNSTATSVGTMATVYSSVTSVSSGIAQNLPALQSFTNSLGLTVTNPQPFVDGRDEETDTEYISRLTYLKSNNTSEQATPAAIKELLDYYEAARIYVNNTQSNYTTPVPIVMVGYTCVILLPSGKTAGSEEIQNAINVLVSRFEFGNILRTSTTIHPLLTGIIYTGTFPQTFTIAPAQVVQWTLNCEISVSFDAATASEEKEILARAFATQFVQNLFDFYGGAAGNFNCSFQEAGSPLPSAVNSTPAILASDGIVDKIGPVIAIEQVRAFISDEATAQTVTGINYLTCDVLTVELDPNESGESAYTLSIDAPTGSTVAVVDFVNDALFSDSTSWYDRYVYLDPSLITVTVTET